MEKIFTNNKLKFKFLGSCKGQSLIELLITIGLASVIIPTLLGGFAATRDGRPQSEQRQQAVALVREGQEITRVVREKDWTAFANLSSTTATYYPLSQSGTWILTSGTQLINGLTRKISISEVYRNPATFAVVDESTPGSIDDPSTKLVTTTVSWNTPLPTSVSATEYLTRFGNVAYSTTGTSQPPAGGNGNWCNPTANILTSYTIGAVPIALTAIKTPTQNYAYVSTGENRSSGSPVFELTISHDNTPVVNNPYSSSDNTKAYGIFSDGTYVYFNEAALTVQIAKISDLSASGGELNIKNVNGAGTVYVVGTAGNPGAVGYTVVGTTLYSFDLSKLQNITTALSSIAVSGTGQKVIISGTNAYVVTDSTSKQLQIIPLLSGGKFGARKDITLGNQPGVDVAIDPTGKYAYVVTKFNSGVNDFYIVDLSNTNNTYGFTTHIPSGQPGAGDMNPQGVTAVTDDKVIVVGCNGGKFGISQCPVTSSGWNYQVFNIPTDPSKTSLCGGMTPKLSDGTLVKSVSAVAGIPQDANGNVYSYIVSGVNSSAQFQVIAGGAGGGGSGNGIFESTTFDAGHNVAFNYFSATINPELSYKLAIKQSVGGVCPSFSDSDFVSISTGPIALPGVGFANPGQCLRYRVINSDTTSIPFTVNINYSP